MTPTDEMRREKLHATDDGHDVDGPASGADPSGLPDRLRSASPSRHLVRPRRRLVFRALLVVVVAAVAYYGVSLWQVWSTGRSDQAQPVDAIVVLGAAQYDGRPSPQLAARLDHVLELWPRNLAPMVVVTGGNQPGDRYTEAEASADYLIARGVPESAIVLENTGRSTFESLHEVAAILNGSGLNGSGLNESGLNDGSGASVLVVTDPYHSLRSRLIAQDAGLTAYVSPTRQTVIQGGRAVRRNLLEAGGVAVGRVIGFGRL